MPDLIFTRWRWTSFARTDEADVPECRLFLAFLTYPWVRFGYGNNNRNRETGKRRQLPDRGARTAGRVHTGGSFRRAAADCQDGDRIHDERSHAGCRSDRSQEFRGDQEPAAQGGRTWAD